MGDDDGAEAGALLYSVVVSCRDLWIDPFEFLRHVLMVRGPGYAAPPPAASLSHGGSKAPPRRRPSATRTTSTCNVHGPAREPSLLDRSSLLA